MRSVKSTFFALALAVPTPALAGDFTGDMGEIPDDKPAPAPHFQPPQTHEELLIQYHLDVADAAKRQRKAGGFIGVGVVIALTGAGFRIAGPTLLSKQLGIVDMVLGGVFIIAGAGAMASIKTPTRPEEPAYRSTPVPLPDVKSTAWLPLRGLTWSGKF